MVQHYAFHMLLDMLIKPLIEARGFVYVYRDPLRGHRLGIRIHKQSQVPL